MSLCVFLLFLFFPPPHQHRSWWLIRIAACIIVAPVLRRLVQFYYTKAMLPPGAPFLELISNISVTRSGAFRCAARCDFTVAFRVPWQCRVRRLHCTSAQEAPHMYARCECNQQNNAVLLAVSGSTASDWMDSDELLPFFFLLCPQLPVTECFCIVCIARYICT